MSGVIERLNSMGLELPDPIKPIASYVPALLIGDFVYTSGHLPLAGGEIIYKGEVGGIFSTVETGAEAAKLCTLNALSSINALIGSLDRIIQVVKVTGYVKSAQLFYDQPKVLNGASDFLIGLFGQDVGKHTRSAIGVNELPLNASVEIELIVQIN